jgi:hypothetical protein
MSKESESQNLDEFDEMDKSDMITLRDELQAQLDVCGQQFKELVEDRRNQIAIVKTLRNTMKEVESMDEGRKELLSEFHKVRKNAEDAKKIRDSMNKLIPPPSAILEKWILNAYVNLTTIDNDLTAIPTLPREKDIFKRFFELQVCIVRKKEAENAHLEYVKNVGELREISKKLDMQREEKRKNISEIESNSEIEVEAVSRKDVRKISKAITSIDKKLDSLKLESIEIRNKLKLVKIAFKKINSRGKVITISQIKEKVDGGSKLDASEFGVLLETGGLTTIAKKSEDKEIKSTKRISNKKKMRRLGTVKRKSRQGNSAALRESDV